MDMTRKQLTNVEPGKGGIGGPMNTFANVPAFPTADMRAVVRPNFDTLYSSGLARPDQGADGRLGAGYRRALLSPADARHVDRRLRVARLAHHRHAGGQLPRRAARLAAGSARQADRGVQAPEGHPAHRRADAVCLDHRPHQDRRPAGLRRGPQDPGRLQDHAAVAVGQDAQAGRGEDRSERRHEDAAEGPGRHHAGRTSTSPTRPSC